MDFGMSNRIPSVVAGSTHFNNYNAPLEPITPLHYYTTMGFSHCSSSSAASPARLDKSWPANVTYEADRSCSSDNKQNTTPRLTHYEYTYPHVT